MSFQLFQNNYINCLNKKFLKMNQNETLRNAIDVNLL